MSWKTGKVKGFLRCSAISDSHRSYARRMSCKLVGQLFKGVFARLYCALLRFSCDQVHMNPKGRGM